MTSRRLTARSVLVSTLLGVSPPELPTRSLIGTAELLGVAAGTARVALSRMVAAGEAEATDGGYRLTSPTLLARQARQSLSRSGDLSSSARVRRAGKHRDMSRLSWRSCGRILFETTNPTRYG